MNRIEDEIDQQQLIIWMLCNKRIGKCCKKLNYFNIWIQVVRATTTKKRNESKKNSKKYRVSKQNGQLCIISFTMDEQ